MANTLGAYNPIFYANEVLIHLRKVLGMASRVHRGIDEERRSFGKGEVINIKRPSTFTAQDAPSTAQDLATDTVALTLAFWKEVKFKLTDKDLAFTQEQIITDHIEPAAYALADDIDQRLAALYKDIPWFYDLAGTTEVKDITRVRKVMFDNSVPFSNPNFLHYMVDGALEAGLLELTAFAQQQGAGEAGVRTQREGHLGFKYGLEVFANQNVQSHTKGTADTGTLAVNGTFAAGVTTINLDAVSVAGTLVAGDSFVIAGNTQRYAVTALNTASGNAFTGVTFTPKLAAAPADDAVVTVRLDDNTSNLAFHRNAFALAMAPLNMMGNELGAKVAMVSDPVSGLAVRSRVFYMPDVSEVNVALDVLYGVTTLDPNLAAIGAGA